MKLGIKAGIKYRLKSPLKHLTDLLRNSDRASSVHVLLASDLSQYTSEQQFAPLLRHAAELRDEYDIRLTHLYVHDLARLPSLALRAFDVVLIKYSFLQEQHAVVRDIKTIRSRLRPDARMIYFDGDDDVCIQWPEVVNQVDLYVKKHVFADPDEYGRPRVGKSNLTEYVSSVHGISFEDDPIPSIQAIPEHLMGKIELGWNIGLDDKIVDLFEESPDATRDPITTREVDVCSRAFCSEDLWIYPFRHPIVEALNRLSPQFNVLTPAARVPQQTYFQEMLNSKICVSPLGFGELCWRDFEAVLCGCVLVKPSVAHIKTKPNIFTEHETYEPIRWDLSDLGDVVTALLEDPERMEQMRQLALARMSDYYGNRQVIHDFIWLLERGRVRVPRIEENTGKDRKYADR